MKESGTVLSTVLTADLLSGVLDEVVALLPAAAKLAVGFAAIRKGWSTKNGWLGKLPGCPLFILTINERRQQTHDGNKLSTE